MPVYEYRHIDEKSERCPLGDEFEWTQSIREDALSVCPECGQPVKRLISRPFISTPQGDSDLKNMGFTKLVKRDQGVYENVTRTGDEKRYMKSGDPSSIPDIKRKISD